MQSITSGTVRNVAYKNAKERYEIWIQKNNESFFPYENTPREGYPIKIRMEGRLFQVGFHKTARNPYMWLSTRRDRDGYDLTDLLKDYSISKNQRLEIGKTAENTYEIKKV